MSADDKCPSCGEFTPDAAADYAGFNDGSDIEATCACEGDEDGAVEGDECSRCGSGGGPQPCVKDGLCCLCTSPPVTPCKSTRTR